MLGDMTRDGEAHPCVRPSNVAQYPIQGQHHLRQHDQGGGELDSLDGNALEKAHGVSPAGHSGWRHLLEELVHLVLNRAASGRSHAHAVLTECRDFVEDAYGIAQTDHQEQKCEMAALVASEPFSQSPINDSEFAGSVVVEQVAGVRIAVK